MNNMQGFELFTLFYIMVCFGLIFPPAEFVSAGFTIQQIFARLLGSETEDFVRYHIRRSMLTLFVFSVFPAFYIACLVFFGYIEMTFLFMDTPLLWKIFFTTSFVLPLFALFQIKKWTDDNFKEHPTVINLSKFGDENRTWEGVASDINLEYRRISKVTLKVSSITTVVITDNWVLKVDPFIIHIARLDDTELLVTESHLFSISQSTNDNQVLTIEVKSTSNKFHTFVIRLNLLAFREVEAQIHRRINVSSGITIHRTDAEQFIEAFREVIKENPKYEPNEEPEERCIGCFQATPNIKLQKLCVDRNGIANCTPCRCRPSWCMQCMGQWFASRQDPNQKEQWLSSKCTCPMCRAQFCLLDVCLINTQT